MLGMEPDLRLPPRYWELLSYLADGQTNADIASRMHLKLKSVENYISDIYTRLALVDGLQMPRVAAAKWYWTRRNLIKNHYIFEVGELPVIIEVRQEPSGNFQGRVVDSSR